MYARIALIGVVGLALVCWTTSAQATVVFSDNFESHTDYATSWVSNTDNDPGVPDVGASWTSRESSEVFQLQVWRDPVTSGNLETPYGDQFLHMWRESQAYTEAWGALTASAQAEVAAQGNLRVEFDVYVLTPDGWGGNLSIAAWDSGSPGDYSNRAFDVSFGGDGIVRLWNGSQTITDPNLDAVFDTDTWEHAIIDTDFVTDTWSITIDGVTVGNIAYEAGNLSKIQQINLGANDRAGRGGRGGWDNLVAQSIPEPSALVLLAAGLMGLRARGRRESK